MTVNKLAGSAGFSEVALQGAVRSDDFPDDGTNPLAPILGAGWTANPLVLDFSRVNFMGSAGIGWIVQTHRELRAGGGRLVCHSFTRLVEQTLSIFNLQSSGLVFVADRAMAVKLLTTPLASQTT
jgi:hypothetical protein